MRKLVLLPLVCLLSFVVRAEVVERLYDTSVPVEEQSERELARAAAEGLETVLIRVSGRQDVGGHPKIESGLNDARRYISQYHYERVEKQPENGNGEEKTQQVVHLSFMGPQITRLLQEAQLPVWSSNRPLLLVWLVVDDGGERRFVTSETDPALLEGLQKHARRRGLPITYPLLDLTDNINLTPEQMWKLDSEALERAMGRYKVDHYLIGRLSSLSSGAWLGSWYFVSNDREFYLDAREPEAAAIARQPVDMVADRLAEQYAIVPSGDGGYSAYIHISGIKEFPQYARAVSYLEQNAAIDHANVVWLSGDAVIMELLLNGTLEKAEQFFELDDTLVSVDPPQQPPRVGVLPRGAVAPAGDDARNNDSQGDGKRVQVSQSDSPGGKPSLEAANSEAAAGSPAPFVNIQGYYRWQGR